VTGCPTERACSSPIGRDPTSRSERPAGIGGAPRCALRGPYRSGAHEVYRKRTRRGGRISATLQSVRSSSAAREKAALPSALFCLAVLLTSAVPAATAAAETRSARRIRHLISVSVGYYDTHHQHHRNEKPSPWRQSPHIRFIGRRDDAGWDTSAVRLKNRTGRRIDNVVVRVRIGSDVFALWGARSIPGHASLILAQTAKENFDGSDTNRAGCVNCDPSLCRTARSSTIPVVRVRRGGSTARFRDKRQILNTGGVDAAGCPYTGTRNDESHDWSRLR
jgi:hypothetical protein